MEHTDQERANHHYSNTVKNLDKVAAIVVSYHSAHTIVESYVKKKKTNTGRTRHFSHI